MRAGFGLAVVLAGLAVAGGALAQLNDSSLNARDRRALAASGLPRASVVSVKSDMVVAIRDRGTASPGGGMVEGVVLQGEVTSAEAARALGYRSMRSTVNIDCERRRDMVVKMTVFTEPGAKGTTINRHVPGGWVQPSPDAYLAHVIRAICGPAPRLAEAAPPPAPKPAAVKPAAAPAAPPRPRPAPPPAAIVAAEPGPQAPASPPVPSDEAPLRTGVEARLTRSRPAPPAETAALPPSPPALRPLTPSAPEASAKPAAKPPPARPRTPGKVAVQIAAADSEAQARAALAKIKGKMTPPLSGAVRSVVVDGKTFHRALVTGFQTRSEAQAFCNGLKGDCFIR
ncbi:SPOR domain-containing protein [Phenylobacterium sp.]|uniref:SPOR domain-containing protein n=1 Tax=Phenylobacterium sp. TaxID=1871053 RepID=UPI0028980E87|nr:SPOR domain-containing protein [Phenylobacterium sp.]